MSYSASPFTDNSIIISTGISTSTDTRPRINTSTRIGTGTSTSTGTSTGTSPGTNTRTRTGTTSILLLVLFCRFSSGFAMFCYAQGVYPIQFDTLDPFLRSKST